MAVPRHRTSNARKRSRRSHHALKRKFVATCANCGGFRVSHTICSSCGHYDGRSVLPVAETQS